MVREGLVSLDASPRPDFDLDSGISPGRWALLAKQAGIDLDLNPGRVLENLRLLKPADMTYTGAWLLADDITRYTLPASGTCAILPRESFLVLVHRKMRWRQAVS